MPGQTRFAERAILFAGMTQTLLGCEMTGHRSAQETVKTLLAQEKVPARITPAGLELTVDGRRLLLVPER